MLDRARGLGISHLEKELGIQPRTYAAPEGKKSLFPAVDRILDEYAEARSFWITGIVKEDILKAARGFIFQYAKEHPGVSEAGVGFEEGLYNSLRNWLPQKDAIGRTINQAARSEVIARTNIMDMYNHARAAMMTSAELAGWVQAYRYSAILDSQTTPLCKHLHGKIFTPETINGFNPPNHFNCRSVLLPVTQLDDGWQKEWEKQGPIKGEPQGGFSAPLGSPPAVPPGKTPIPGATLEGAQAKAPAPKPEPKKPKAEEPVPTPNLAELMPDWELLPQGLLQELAILKADLHPENMIKPSQIGKIKAALEAKATEWFKKNAGYVPEVAPRVGKPVIVEPEAPFPEIEAAKKIQAAKAAQAAEEAAKAKSIIAINPKVMWDLAMKETGWTNPYETQPSWLKQKINSWVQKLKQAGPMTEEQAEAWAKGLANKLPDMISKGPSVGQQEKAAMKGKKKGEPYVPGPPGFPNLNVVEPAAPTPAVPAAGKPALIDLTKLEWAEKGPQNTKFWPKKFGMHTEKAMGKIQDAIEAAFPGLEIPAGMTEMEWKTALQKAIAKGVANAYPGKAGYQLKLVTAETFYPQGAPTSPPVAPKAAPPTPTPTPAPKPPQAPPEPLFGPEEGTIAKTVPTGDAANILKTKVGDAKGSNPGGTYTGADGVTRYVKFYEDPAQAYSEAVANNLYAAMGLGAPKSVVFVHQGKLAIASEIISGAKTIKDLGALGAVDARTILRGFATDVLTANWDAVGTGFDNVMRLADGKILRVDQGGSLLFRAKAGRKGTDLLNEITEVMGFADSGKNPNYSQVFQKAGINTAAELGADLTRQIDKIQALRAKTNNFADLVPKVDGVPDADRNAILKMLRSRADLMNVNLRREVHEFLNPPPPPPPVEVTGRGAPTDPIIKKVLEEFDRAIGGVPKRGSRTEPFDWGEVDGAIRRALTTAQNAKFASSFIEMRDRIWEQWKGSAVSEAAGMGKFLAERAGLSAETTYHSQGFMDKDPARRSQFVRHYEGLVKKWEAKYGKDVVDRYAQLEYQLTQKLLKKAYPDGKLPTIYRGVTTDWFQVNGLRAPQVSTGNLTDCVVHQSSVSGFSTSPNLSFGGRGGWKFQTDPQAEEIFTTYFMVKGAGGSYKGEREWWFLSAGPQRFKVTRM